MKAMSRMMKIFKTLKEENESLRNMRLQLSESVGMVIKHAMSLLGIDVPERM